MNSYTDNLKRILREADDFSVLVEFYASDAVPSFNPINAVKRYAATGDFDAELSTGNFFGATYKRLVRSYGSFRRTITAEVNRGSVDFSNLDNEISAFELSQTGFEGLVKVVRLVSRSQSILLSDSYIIFVGRCDKPKSGTREKMSVSAQHILGGVNSEIPRRKMAPEDAEGRHPSAVDFEGFRFQIQYGSVSYSVREKRGGLLGLFGLKKTVTKTLPYSSYSDLDASKFLPEALGRVQMIGTHIGYDDVGVVIRMLTAFCEGEIEGYFNARTVNSGFTLDTAAYAELKGAIGGQGTQFPDPTWVSPGYYSRTAHLRCQANGSSVQNNDPAPDVVSVILGRKMLVPNINGNWLSVDWSDDGAAHTRFVLTSPDYYKLNSAWLDDASFLEVFNFNKEIIFDSSYSDTLFVPQSLAGASYGAAVMAQLLRSTAVCSPNYFQYLNKTKTAAGAFLMPVKKSEYDGTANVTPIDPNEPPENPNDPPIPTANLFFFLRRRYVSNVVITESVKLIDFLHDVIFPASRMYFSQGTDGKLKLNSKKPVDFALASAQLSGSTIALDDISKWITDKTGQLLVDPNTAQSEARGVTQANYATAQNTVALAASTNIQVFQAFAGSNGAGTPATARLRVVTVQASNFVNLDGVQIPFTASVGDTIDSIAGFIFGAINGEPTLRRKFAAAWVPGSNDIFITAKFGTLNLDAPLAMTHAAPLANPTVAPVIAAASGGTLAAGIYKVAYAHANERGQTLLSPFALVTLTANQKINVGASTLPVGATVAYYCSPAAGSRQLRFVKQNSGAAFEINILPKVSNSLPPDLNRTGAEVLRVAQVFSDRAEIRSNINKSNVLKASFEFLPERKSPVNQVELTFRDSTQDFRLSRIILRDDAHIKRTAKVSKLEINGQAIDSYHQAYRIASGLLAENRDADFFYKWTADREALLLEEGSVVCITDAGSGVYNLPVRIETVDININKGFPTVTFTARKYSTTLHDDLVSERQIPVVVESGAAANFSAQAALYKYTPTAFTPARTFDATAATLAETKNALATVMDDLEKGRK